MEALPRPSTPSGDPRKPSLKEPRRRVEYVRVPIYWESCVQCGKDISAPTERKLAYLLAAHRYEKHKGPEPEKGVNY